MSTWTWYKGDWHEGNPPIMGPGTHAAWLGSIIFDGARAFEGVAPDLDLHCQRAVNSARALELVPTKTAEEILALAREGIAKHRENADLYIRPMFWGTEGFVVPDPDSTDFCITLIEMPMPAEKGMSLALSPFRRPTLETAPTNAKAACLYPNSARALSDANRRGFDNALMLDTLGAVAELTSANIWMAKDGVAFTPVPNGTFLAGITRMRAMKLLRSAGVEVVEKQLRIEDFRSADEIFSTGNFGKVVAVTRLDDQDFEMGPVYRKARELYWAFAHGDMMSG